MRRLTLLLAGAALWLFLAAIPALADGGPHVASENSGSSTLTADSCAGCHRVHTAQAPLLLKTEEAALCTTCHGAASTGATTDVMTGIQYAPATDGTRTGTQLGALRGGGFDQARISSGNPARVIVSNLLSSADDQWAKVTVRDTPQDVTSAHINLAENGLSAPGKAWGNGANGSGAGPTVSMSCGSCHNPHGNGQYRILNPIPGDGSGPLVEATVNAIVTDAPNPSNATRNYTVIQTQAPYKLLASDVVGAGYSSTSGDYWHVRVPWNSASGTNDAPNGIPSGVGVSFQSQMTAWCLTCHTRYVSESAEEPYPDAVFMYRHETSGNRACTTCHVSHGSNARMDGAFSRSVPFPDGSTVTYQISGTTGDSRLLKVDGRGTCQLCHDPTYTELNNTYRGPTPTPGVP